MVGRLDRDSEGLLLLTDDGKFTAKVLSEGCHKRYWALVQGSPSESSLSVLRRGGLEIRGAVTRPPISVRVLTKDEIDNSSILPDPVPGMNRPGSWIEIILNEGRNRQIRRMTAAVGHKTIRLCRVAVGRFSLSDCGYLLPGEWKYIDRDQI